MDRLSALDAAWLELEGDGPPIAIGTVTWAHGPAPDHDELLTLLRDRLPRMARLHQRVDDRPGPLRRPAWLPDDDDAVEPHLHRVSLGGEADRDRVDAEVGLVMTSALDRHRPLWDLWVLDGLADDAWALVWRVHHSVADGVGTLMLLGHAYDLEPDGGTTLSDAISMAAGPRPPSPDAGPTALPDLLGRALRIGTRRAAAAVRVAGAAVATLPHLPAAAAVLVPRPGDSSLTGPVGCRRRWVSVDLPLAEVKRVARAHGTTVNDVVLAAVTGGFRDLLLSRGEDVHGRVVRNLVPVSERPTGDDRSDNQVSGLFTTLPVGEPDPSRRLELIREQVHHLKGAHAHVVGPILFGLADLVVPWQVQDEVVTGVGNHVPSWFIDTLTTNVPGPQFPLYLMGRRVEAMYPLIPVAGRTRITVGVFSYDGTINVGVTGDADAAGDVDVLARGMRAEVDRLTSSHQGEVPQQVSGPR